MIGFIEVTPIKYKRKIIFKLVNEDNNQDKWEFSQILSTEETLDLIKLLKRAVEIA